MNKLITLFYIVSSLLILSGCGIAIQNIADDNRANTVRIEMGMTRTEVDSIMGKGTVVGISNPYKKEIFYDSKNRLLEVYYYYVERFATTEEEQLIPIVLFEGKVEGIGWRSLDATAKKYDIQIRNR
ncbi:MAG: hypothetical protein ABR980_12560 [Ignavibacteriaceae bacterium]|jgi:hypothetical protein